MVSVACTSGDDDASENEAGSSSTAPSTTVTEPSERDTVGPFEVEQVDGELLDPARDRLVPYRVYAPIGLDGKVPVIVVSHGGLGSDSGYTRGGHLGSTFAEGGFVAIHVGHLPSATDLGQIDDRPADVTFLLDQVAAGTATMPTDFTGEPDLDRVGHTGHSFGAYTSHAVGGAQFAANHRDGRIDAIAPMSPQGAGQFGAFDNGGDDNTWATVMIPAYNLVGGDEIATNARGTVFPPGWRLTPFERYGGEADTFLTVIDGQSHSDMWNSGTDQVETFVAEQILRFMQVYVAQDPDVDACAIGVGDAGVPTITTRHAASVGSSISSCAD